jgi:hypothetical protein
MNKRFVGRENMRLGIDIGRVLISPQSNGRDTSFIGGSIQDAIDTPPYEGMFEAVPKLVKVFGGKVWLVSKAGPRVEEKTRLWLQHQKFFVRTGIPAQNLRFCLKRPDKAEHCRNLSITHFIDDRLDVLEYLEGIVKHRFLFGPQSTNQLPTGIAYVPSWDKALEIIGTSVCPA